MPLAPLVTRCPQRRQAGANAGEASGRPVALGHAGKRKKQSCQNTCITPMYAPVWDSPANGFVGELESRGVAKTEKLPFLLLFA